MISETEEISAQAVAGHGQVQQACETDSNCRGIAGWSLAQPANRL